MVTEKCFGGKYIIRDSMSHETRQNNSYSENNVNINSKSILGVITFVIPQCALQPFDWPIRMHVIKYLQLDGEENFRTKERKRGQDKRMRIFSFACPRP